MPLSSSAGLSRVSPDRPGPQSLGPYLLLQCLILSVPALCFCHSSEDQRDSSGPGHGTCRHAGVCVCMEGLYTYTSLMCVCYVCSQYSLDVTFLTRVSLCRQMPPWCVSLGFSVCSASTDKKISIWWEKLNFATTHVNCSACGVFIYSLLTLNVLLVFSVFSIFNSNVSHSFFLGSSLTARSEQRLEWHLNLIISAGSRVWNENLHISLEGKRIK